MLSSRSALVAAGAVLALTGCASTHAPAQPKFAVPELHTVFTVPGALADLTYAMGTSSEGKPAANSTKALTAAGGPGCAAGAKNSVSPFPMGQIVLSPETPAQVAQETKDNPDDVLGEFVAKVGSGYFYYLAPPAEGCAPANKTAVALQLRATKALRTALNTGRAAP